MDLARFLSLFIVAVCSCVAENGSFNTGSAIAAKRNVITDHGYGSRVNAGTKVADDLATRHHVYSVYGPGKRSALDRNVAVTTNDSNVVVRYLLKQLYRDPKYKSKMTADRTTAGDKLVKGDSFGARGTDKMSMENGHTPKRITIMGVILFNIRN